MEFSSGELLAVLRDEHWAHHYIGGNYEKRSTGGAVAGAT